jgi:hypothetical protein
MFSSFFVSLPLDTIFNLHLSLFDVGGLWTHFSFLLCALFFPASAAIVPRRTWERSPSMQRFLLLVARCLLWSLQPCLSLGSGTSVSLHVMTVLWRNAKGANPSNIQSIDRRATERDSQPKCRQ